MTQSPTVAKPIKLDLVSTKFLSFLQSPTDCRGVIMLSVRTLDETSLD